MKEDSYAHQGSIYLIKKTVKTVVVMIGGCNTRMTNGVQQTKGQIY